MNISAGKILISTDAMDDPNFQGAVVFITEYNEDGATGLVVNKIFERPLNALAEFSSSPSFPLYDGGPVDREHLFFLHRRNDLIAGGTPVSGDIFFSGDFKQAIVLINNKTLKQSDIKIFIGYCGWNSGELEEEIAEGSWTIVTDSADTVFAN